MNKLLRQNAKRASRAKAPSPEIETPPEPLVPKEVEEISGVNAEAQEKELIRLLLQFGSCVMPVEMESEEEGEEKLEKEISVAEFIWMELDMDGIELHHPTLRKMYAE